MSKVYKHEKDAIRSARKVHGKEAKKGVHFSISGSKETGFSWEALSAAVLVVPDAPEDKSETAPASLSAAATPPVPEKPVKVARIKTKVKAKVDAKRGRKPLERAGDVSGKRLQMFKMISRDSGASLDTLTNALGWQKHTVRGAVSTIASQFGVRIKSFRDDRRGRVYKAQIKKGRSAKSRKAA